MASIIIPRRWTQQPQGPVEPNMEYDGLGLKSLFTPMYDAKQNKVLSTYVSANIVSGEKGRAWSSEVEDNYILVNSNSSKILSTNGNTFVICFRKTDGVLRSSTLFGIPNGVNTERFSSHAPWDNGDLYFDFGGISGNNRLYLGGLNFSKASTLVYSGGSRGMSIYRNGELLANSSVPVTRVSTTDAFLLNSGNLATGDLVEIYMAALFSTQLPDSMQKELSINPWQLFKPRKQFLYFFSSISKPNKDISTGPWNGYPNAPLFDKINSNTNESTYIEASTSGSAIVGMSEVGNPGNNQVISYKNSSDTGLELILKENKPCTIIIPRRWTQQPQGPVMIDWSNPLSAFLTYANVGGSNVFPKNVANLNGTTLRSYKLGVGVYNTYSNNYVDGGKSYNLNAGNMTVLVDMKLDTLTANSYPAIFTQVDDSNIPQLNFHINHEPGTYQGAIYLRRTGIVDQARGSVENTVVNNGVYRVVATAEGTSYSGIKLYSNGIETGYSVVNQSDGVTLTGANNTVFSGRPLATRGLPGTIGLVLAWKRALSAQEVASISADPWQIFKSRKQVLYFDSSKIITTINAITDGQEHNYALNTQEKASITDYSKLILEARRL